VICNPCKAEKHEECPSKLAADIDKPTTGLSPEGDAVQRSGLCPCHHRVNR
jgi:hypothetical protein